MALSRNQIVGILLLVSLAMLYLDVPFVDQRAISSLILLGAGIYLIAVK